MGHESWIQSFVLEHEGEPIAKVVEEMHDKKAVPIEYLSIFVDYCNMHM